MSTAPDGGWPGFPAGPPPGVWGKGDAATPVPSGPGPAVDWKWRLRHSWWLLLPLLGCSCLGGAGLLYVGLRARRPAWWIPGAAYLVLGWAGFLLVDGKTGTTSTRDNIGVSLFLAATFACLLHSVLVNPGWLRWRAGWRPWYQQPAGAGLAPPPVGWPPPAVSGFPPAYPGSPVGPGPGSPIAPVSGPGSPFAPTGPGHGPPGGLVAPGYPTASTWPAADPATAPWSAAVPPTAPWPAAPADPPRPGTAARGEPTRPWVDPTAPAATPAAATTVDVNTAPAGQLAGLPGFDAARAQRVLGERERRGGFGSVAEFVAAADLAPHEYARLRDILVCVPPAGPATPGQPHGRVLDF
ncbi:ComEA family DNA-binding protein [Micromonospora auratinigra]|uniref:Helix-hairpin-helix motif-containing protein n=1 Tax=Micromonospora auratinigra TaxID=261654 RepID=A0A1A9A8V6_9ACTN|nr:type II secretion system protein GspK [Micromonospora auratinigra]SBT52550.1 Helix-hairpin-helix motif-containing protein [Micromonospora auratinigra]